MLTRHANSPPGTGRGPRLAIAAAAVALGCLGAASWLSLSRCSSPASSAALLHSPTSTTYTPFSLPLAERHWAYEAARLEVPTLVTRLRRLLTVQLALTALLNDVPGDFVETGVFTGGTSILMVKTLERYDPGWGGTGGPAASGSAGSGTDSSGTDSSSSGSSRRGSGGGGGHGGRRLWAADSFQGTPEPVAQDQGGTGREG